MRKYLTCSVRWNMPGNPAHGLQDLYAASIIVIAATGDPGQRLILAVLAQDVFFSTQLKDSASGKWLGGPQVLLQGTMNGNVTDVIVIMNA